ncbi:MAG TPA: DMT family transporter [Thermoanaerobaculia bacterium]
MATETELAEPMDPADLPAASSAGPPAAAGPDLRVQAVLVAVQVCFGIFHVVGKAVLAEMAPLALAGIRALVAAPLLMALAWRIDRVLPRRRDLPMLALLGALGVLANQVLFIEGLKRTTATNAAIIMVAIPVFAVAVGALLGIERLGMGRLAGVALSIAGALILLDPTRLTLGSDATLGNALILTNAFCYAAFLVLQRPILRRLPWRTVIAWAFLFGGGGVLLFAWPDLAALPGAHLSRATWWGVAYIVLFPTAFAYAASTWAVRRSSPSLVAAYGTLQPLVTASLAAIFLGERFGWPQGIGFALIVAGLWRVSVRAAP